MKKYKKVVIYLVILCLIIGAIFLMTYKKHYLPGKFFGGMNDGILLVTDGKKYGYYDVNERKLKIDIKYDLPKNLKDFYSDYSKIDTGSMKIFEEGKKLISNFNYKYGYIRVKKNNLYGLVDKNENIILEPKYRDVMAYGKNLILVCEDYFYFVNSKGEKLTNKEYTILSQVDNNKLFLAKVKGKYELLSDKFTNIFDKEYDLITVFGSKGYYVIQTKDGNNYSYYLLNYNEKKLEKLPIDTSINIKNFDNNVITYQKKANNYYNFNILSQKQSFLGIYKDVGRYVDGLAYVIDMDNKINYIDYDGNVVIPLNYNTDFGIDFTEYGLAVVYDNDKSKIIDTHGNIKSDGYSYSQIINDKLFILGNSGLNLFNDKIKPISDEYEGIYPIKNNDKYLLVSKQTKDGERYGLINYNGIEVEPCNYLQVDVYDDYLVLQEEVGKNIIKKLD